MRLQTLTLAGTLAMSCSDPLQQNTPLQPDTPRDASFDSRWRFDAGVDVPPEAPDTFQQPFRRDVSMDVRPDIPRDMDCIPARCEGGVILRERAEIDDGGVRQELCVRFPEVSSRVGLTSVGENRGLLVFDANGDGRPDVLVLKRATPPELFQNSGGTFTNVTTRVGLNTAPISVAATAGDYDGDGDQDLFFVGSNGNVLLRNDVRTFVHVPNAISPEDTRLRGTAAVFIGSLLLFGTEQGTRAYRYGSGRWTEVTRPSGLEDRHGEASDFAVTHYGGRTHIYISNSTGSNSHRQGRLDREGRPDGTFESIERSDGTIARGASMDADWVTFQEEPTPSLSVVTYNDRFSAGAGNFFFVRNPDGTFTDQAARLGIRDPGQTMCVVWEDFLGDQRPWQFSCRDQQPNLFYIPRLRSSDRVVERFEDYAFALGMDRVDGRTVTTVGAAVLDYDGDGKKDLVFAYNDELGRGGLRLFHNETTRIVSCPGGER